MNKTLLKPQVLIALLAAGTMVFHSCKDKNEVIQDDPGATPAESVKTSFAFNLPQVGKTGTRMSAANTQANGQDFIGMYNIKLLPRNATEATGNGFTSIIDLAPIGNTDLNNNQKIYSDISIPVGTTNFLFYGIGGVADPVDPTPGTPNNNDKFARGVLTSNFPTDAANYNTDNITFALEKAYAKVTQAQTDSTNLLTVLNAVAVATGNGQAWSTYTTNTVLQDLYAEFTKLKAGSAEMIRLTLQDLYNAVYGFTTSANATDKAIATAITKAIRPDTDPYFEATQDGPTGIWKLSYADGLTTKRYPENCNLPQGAAQVKFENGAFSYIDNAITNPIAIATGNICFPASLYYFTNTAAWATDAVSPTWPTSTTDWAGYNWTNNGWYNTVRESTHAIALANNIQYSVASLKTTVKCNGATLEDNKKNAVNVPTDGFPVTGILIAGQPEKVNWSFASDETTTQIIYDNEVDIKAKNDGPSPNPATGGNNYTLLLENKVTTGNQNNVSMVIELENTSNTPFQGKDGVVPVGAKFYLVATLVPGNGTQPATPIADPAVFMQDYVTTANLTINSLASASVTIPDLRNTEMSLGISVDLEWQAGLVFDININ